MEILLTEKSENKNKYNCKVKLVGNWLLLRRLYLMLIRYLDISDLNSVIRSKKSDNASILVAHTPIRAK